MARLTRSNSCLSLLFAAALLLWGSPVQAGNPGEAGFLSLRFPVGAREAGMGDAGVAASQGAAAVFWNPANNIFHEFDTTLILQHYRYVGAMSQEAAALAHKVGDGVLGLIFMGFYSDEIPRRSAEPVGIDEGFFKPYDVAFGLSYAHPLGDSFALGMNAKLVYERIDFYSDTGMAYDFFMSHKALIEGMMFGASLTNVGKQKNLYDGPFDLPTAYKFGYAYTPNDLFLQENVTFAGDIFIPKDTSAKVHVGCEYRVVPELTLRVGSKINYDLYGLTAGFGVALKNFNLDYAYQDMIVDGFEVGHKFALNMVW
ncbi:MAG: PorV/PorQ family protein [Gemmatimonadales bacterium]|nr:PorV/PorQ family protein [Gemmatimonadales bacterium]